MELMSIASGSSGNSIFVGTDKTSILLDCGISMKRIEEGLRKADRSGVDVDAILITHEHSDHIKSLGVLARKYSIPIYATAGTIDGITSVKSLGDYDHELFNYIGNSESFSIGDITVNAHSVSHDAADPVCYTFEAGGSKVAIATDMGVYDEDIVDFLGDSDAMLIESNHDVRMLEVGPYPFQLKQRILSKWGHLSNETSGELVRRLLNNHLKFIALGHLSDKNNYSELAFETVRQAISDNEYTNDVRDFGLCVASRDQIGALIRV